MRFRPEPPHTHGGPAGRTAVLLVNLGTPDAPTAPAVRRYLAEFLSDPRVVEIPQAIWQLILKGIILPRRSGKSAAKYAAIWTKHGSPLRFHTERQAVLLRGFLGQRGPAPLVVAAMRYGQPAIGTVLDQLKAGGVERILVLPLYPQYAASTTASAFDAVARWAATVRNQPEFRFVRTYHDHPAYIGALAARVQETWKRENRLPGRPLVLSFHGVPKRTLLAGDPYHCQCLKTGRLLGEALKVPAEDVFIAFQSRFGRGEWVGPATSEVLAQLGRKHEAIDVFCPGFPADCLETLEEIALDGKQTFMAAGGRDYRYIPCLNDHAPWIHALADLAQEHLQGWPLVPAAGHEEQAARQREAALLRGAKA